MVHISRPPCRRLLIITAMLSCSIPLHAQIDSSSVRENSMTVQPASVPQPAVPLPQSPEFERLIEAYADANAETDHAEQFIEELERIARSPWDLRHVKRPQLEALGFLAPASVTEILRLQNSETGIVTWRQIDTLPGMYPEAAGLLRRYTCMDCSPRVTGLALTAGLRSRFTQDAAPRYGFLNGSYAGSRLRSYHRIEAQMDKRFSGGILIEKDPGELSFTDHVAGYASMEQPGLLRRLILGDFTVASGQGLVFWKQFSMAKGGNVLSGARKTARMLSPYLSATESMYYRGAAVELSYRSIDALLFFSRNSMDARIDSVTGSVGSFDVSGLHRTSSEWDKTGAVDETLLGGALSWQPHRELKFRLNGYSSGYSHRSLPRVPFAFEGSRAWLLSLDWQTHHSMFSTFGEAALSHTGTPAYIAGLSAQLTRNVGTTILWRSYDERFMSLHGNGFGERGGNTQNEQGVYFGLRYRINRQLLFEMYFDYFRFPNRTYYLNLASSGREWQTALRWRPAKSVTVLGRYRNERKDKSVAGLDAGKREIRPMTQRNRQAIRLELQIEPQSGLRFRLRGEHVGVSYACCSSSERGWLLFADVRCILAPFLAVSARLVSYDTDSYDSRVYEFENDHPGMMTNIALYGAGVRSYVLLSSRISGSVTCSAKYGQTFRDSAKNLGSGNDRVDGDSLGNFSLQIDMGF